MINQPQSNSDKIRQPYIIIALFHWYYIDGLRFVLEFWYNFLAFTFHYFSIGVILRTFFAPWKRYCESYGRGFDFKRYFNAFLSNVVFRLVGVLARLVLILAFLISQFLVISLGIGLFLIWLFLPLLLVVGIIGGFYFIF